MWEGNRNYWEEFEWASSFLGSSAMWKADWDCRPSFMCSPKSHCAVTSWSQPAWDGFQPVFSILFFVLWELRTFYGNFGICFLSLLLWFLFKLGPFILIILLKPQHLCRIANLSLCRSAELLLLTEWSYISDTCPFLNLKTKTLSVWFPGCHSEQEHLVRDQTASLPAEDAGPKHISDPNWKDM